MQPCQTVQIIQSGLHLNHSHIFIRANISIINKMYTSSNITDFIKYVLKQQLYKHANKNVHITKNTESYHTRALFTYIAKCTNKNVHNLNIYKHFMIHSIKDSCGSYVQQSLTLKVPNKIVADNSNFHYY